MVLEQSWLGRRLAIGEAELEVVVPCPRCVMITHPFDDLPRDPGLGRTVVREAAQNVGFYARVARPGRVRVGDAVTLLDWKPDPRVDPVARTPRRAGACAQTGGASVGGRRRRMSSKRVSAARSQASSAST